MTNILCETTDDELMREVGARLRSYRLQQNLTVVSVAERAGVNPNTVLNVEAGKNPRLLTILRLLRVYGRLDAVDAFLPASLVSPLSLAKQLGRVRQRARPNKDG